VRAALKAHEIEAVIHLAALIEAILSVVYPERFFQNNIGGSIGALGAMVEAGVKELVFSSTAALYADPERLPIEETAPTRPTNPYGVSKLMVEQILASALPIHGIAATALRHFNAAGATERGRQVHEPETHLLPLVLRAGAAGRSIPIYGTDSPPPTAPRCATTSTSSTSLRRTCSRWGASSRGCASTTSATAWATRCAR